MDELDVRFLSLRNQATMQKKITTCGNFEYLQEKKKNCLCRMKYSAGFALIAGNFVSVQADAPTPPFTDEEPLNLNGMLHIWPSFIS